MQWVDVNCLTGHWPFRRIYKNTFEDLQNIHKENGIAIGYVSSLNSIFYADPFEGDEELHDTIRNTSYKHILTINPMLPCFEGDVDSGIAAFNIAGVRIYPGYHTYSLDCTQVHELACMLTCRKLPLFLTLRLEDERLNYLLQPRQVDLQGIRAFIEAHQDLKIVLMNIRVAEVMSLEKTIRNSPNLNIDTSGFKDQLFNVEKIVTFLGDDKILYGSQYPLNCLKSTLFEVTKADITTKSKEKILVENSRQL